MTVETPVNFGALSRDRPRQKEACPTEQAASRLKFSTSTGRVSQRIMPRTLSRNKFSPRFHRDIISLIKAYTNCVEQGVHKARTQNASMSHAQPSPTPPPAKHRHSPYERPASQPQSHSRASRSPPPPPPPPSSIAELDRSRHNAAPPPPPPHAQGPYLNEMSRATDMARACACTARRRATHPTMGYPPPPHGHAHGYAHARGVPAPGARAVRRDSASAEMGRGGGGGGMGSVRAEGLGEAEVESAASSGTYGRCDNEAERPRAPVVLQLLHHEDEHLETQQFECGEGAHALAPTPRVVPAQARPARELGAGRAGPGGGGARSFASFQRLRVCARLPSGICFVPRRPPYAPPSASAPPHQQPYLALLAHPDSHPPSHAAQSGAHPSQQQQQNGGAVHNGARAPQNGAHAAQSGTAGSARPTASLRTRVPRHRSIVARRARAVGPLRGERSEARRGMRSRARAFRHSLRRRRSGPSGSQIAAYAYFLVSSFPPSYWYYPEHIRMPLHVRGIARTQFGLGPYARHGSDE
ncbi:hypothetical protein FB451DRAFT_1183954 [Mycena latifolia]|nr:hypothetical protein FB451DRAFT_1183954 [Mycena latifolia]